MRSSKKYIFKRRHLPDTLISTIFVLSYVILKYLKWRGGGYPFAHALVVVDGIDHFERVYNQFFFSGEPILKWIMVAAT